MKDLYKIISGKIILDFRQLKIVVEAPSALERYEAEIYAANAYEEACLEGIMTDEEMLEFMLETERWSTEQQQQLEKIPKEIEALKKDYFRFFHVDSKTKFLKDAIQKSIRLHKKLTAERYRLFDKTAEGIQTLAYSKFLLSKYQKESISINQIHEKYTKETLSHEEVREVSKKDQWKLMWSTSKEPSDIFGCPVKDCSEMQLSLINWSRVYDSVYESPERPSEGVIDDDFALDGWFLLQREKRVEEQKGKEAANITGKEEGDVFVPVNTMEEAKRVFSMNSEKGKRESKQRFNELENRGTLDEGEFNYVKRDLAMQAIQARKRK